MQDCYYAFRNTHRKKDFCIFPGFYILISSSNVLKRMVTVGWLVVFGRLTAANFHRSRETKTHALASISYPLGRKDFEI